MAHTFVDLEEATLDCLQGEDGDTALDRAQKAFLLLAFFELGVIQEIRRTDLRLGLVDFQQPLVAQYREIQMVRLDDPGQDPFLATEE
jgi:hypothetical protein